MASVGFVLHHERSQAAELAVAGADVPVLGVNVGQLGYLAVIEPGAAREALERFLDGTHRVEQRMLLEVRGHRAATVSVDGRNLGELAEGDAVCCTAAERSAHLVTMDPRDFLSTLEAKFGLDDR